MLEYAVYKKIQLKKSGPSVSSVQSVLAVSESVVPQAESEPTVARFPVYPNPFRIFDHEIQLASGVASADNNSDEEEVIPLLDPRRHKSACNVSSLGHEQSVSAGRLPTDSNISIQSAYGNRDQKCPSPQIFR